MKHEWWKFFARFLGATPQADGEPKPDGRTASPGAEARRSALLSTKELPTLKQAERDLILQALALCHGNKEEAARALGISVRTIYRRLEEYGGEDKR